MIEYSHKIKEKVKATQSEIKKNIQGTNSEGKETGTLGHLVCLAPQLFLPVSLCCAPVWDRWVCQPLPCHESSPPCCPSPPLLLVWMNVSSLSPWLSDFHAVRFSVSSGCFLFLNCCCPSFGCARRHSVSTYASILAGSSKKFF